MDNEHINQLVTKAKNNDYEAYTELMKIYQPRIVNVARKYLVPAADIPDIVQEVFIKVLKYIHTFKGESAFYTWLYKVTTSVIKNYLTQSKKIPHFKTVDQNISDYMDFMADMHENSNPQDILVSDETKNNIIKTLDSLPKALKDVILLREIEGLSYLDISNALEIPEGTVRSRIHRARNIIQNNIDNIDIGSDSNDNLPRP